MICSHKKNNRSLSKNLHDILKKNGGKVQTIFRMIKKYYNNKFKYTGKVSDTTQFEIILANIDEVIHSCSDFSFELKNLDFYSLI
jgi:hypothetical protein